LVQQGLHKAIDDKRRKSVTMNDDEWEDLDVRDLNAIWLCLVDDVLINNNGEETKACLWSTMERLYMMKSLMNQIYLKRHLYTLKMKEGMKIIDHLNVFNTLIFQLNSMEVKLDDEDKTITLLCSLPESWDHLVTSISFSTIETLEFDIVVGALFFEGVQRKSSVETSTPEEMVVRGQSKEKGERSRGTPRSN
jgi:hypothetical protein